ncbi:MAG: hypothetical protein FWE77_02955 [Clostridia bacterium]|nr:hypothetical protein [Clostridia bacterium]
MKIDLSCPIELYDYQLPTAEQPYCALVFFNLSQQMVRSVQVSLTLLDGEGNAMLRRMERVMGLEAPPKEWFEANVAVEDEDWIQRADLVIEKVWFDDATVWRIGEGKYHKYEPNLLPPGRLLEHLQRAAGPDAAGFPSDQGAIWVCVCGRPNRSTEAECRRCGRDKQTVFAQYTPAAVQAQIEEQDRQQQEQAKRAHEEAVREEAQRKAQEKRRRRKRRLRAALMTTALTLAIGAYLFVTFGLPELRYRQAEDLLRSGDPQRAKELFLSLGDYRGADQRVQETDLGIARVMLDSHDPAERERGLRALDAMTDHPQAQAEASAFRYGEALAAMDEGDYQRAETVLRQLGDHEDAPELLLDAAYQLASQAMNRGEYEEAGRRFAALGAYRDAPSRALDAIYRRAGQLIEEGEYLRAVSLYNSIADYRDSVDLARHGLYQYALELKSEGRYEEASQQFERLGAYLDSAEQALDCAYAPATALMEAGKYEEAAALFATVPEHLDAAELARESVYLQAAALAEKGEYQRAIELFASISDYKDAEALAQAAAYAHAGVLMDEGKLEEAAQAFAALGDQGDAAARGQEARYQIAEQALQAGDLPAAQGLFEALDGYRDAADRAKAIQYARAEALMAEGNWLPAAELFRGLGTYMDAGEQANQSEYNHAQALRAANRLEEAAAVFASLGKFEDAAAMVNVCRYEQAEQYELAGEYAAAGRAFAALGSFQDAQERSQRAYDRWLSGIKARVDAAMEAENYAQVLQLLKDVPLDDIPAAYSGLVSSYRTATLSYARTLINIGDPLAAYPYLMRVDDMREARTLLNSFIFMLLGAWESPTGQRAEFRPDGTCLLDGEQFYFNVANYALMIGDTPKPQRRTHAIVRLNERQLTLQSDAGGPAVQYNRVATAEALQTE